MAKISLTWRGCLKSCNYSCSYCPFSKHPISKRELLKDKEQWLSFCKAFEDHALELNLGALLVTPYGEALIHPWYWEGLGRLSRLDSVDMAGAQTNLSFPLEENLRLFDAAGGIREKLCLWATFHPEMTDISSFTSRCRMLKEMGIRICAGAIGVPDQARTLSCLRKELPEDIYLWINPMDGLGRPYTPEETAFFRTIDPYFSAAAACPSADPSMCRNRIAVEGDGSLRGCTIGRKIGQRKTGIQNHQETQNPDRTEIQLPWIQELIQRRTSDIPSAWASCGQRRCSCYLAYGGRKDYPHRFFFGPYSIFRIPWQAQAVFFDIDGTLLEEVHHLSAEACTPPQKDRRRRQLLVNPEWLEELSRTTPLFLATALPYRDAKRRFDSARCGKLFSLFQGGVFGGGSHIRLEKEYRERILPLELGWLPEAEKFKEDMKFRILLYRENHITCKGVLTKLPGASDWTSEEVAAITSLLSSFPARICPDLRRIQILPQNAEKAKGAALLCSWLNIPLKQCAAAGNSPDDLPLLKACGFSMAPEGSHEDVLEEVHYIYRL